MTITDELEDELFAMQKAITTREDLEEFLEFLEGKYNNGLVDEKDLGDFIGDASDMFGSAQPEDMKDGLPTWKFVGEAILAAVLRD